METIRTVEASGGQSSAPATADAPPTVWGLSVRELHDAYWRARGVQCVRVGEEVAIDRAADLYLLIEPDQLVLFDVGEILEHLVWRGVPYTRLRLLPPNGSDYAERVVLDEAGFVERIQRVYESPYKGSRRVGLATRPRIARKWMQATSSRAARLGVRQAVSREDIDRIRISGLAYEGSRPEQQRDFLRALVERWPNPDQAISGITEVADGVWKPQGEMDDGGVTLVGPLWMGFGHSFNQAACLVGPTWVPDDPSELPSSRTPISVLDMVEIESGESHRHVDRTNWTGLYPVAKRTFDVLSSAVVLIAMLPVMGVIALAIVWTDGRPVFYKHRRQTRGGREFDCLKFRTMYNNAEAMVEELREKNLCDGPQVYIENDPRVTRVGHVLRRYQLDELPQLLNVIRGEMSIVGPRPSPERENQYCPAWRELRLSVRPGITGLWQLNRTRQPGHDFQEWIRYDVEYVRDASFWLDMKICFRTARMFITGRGTQNDQ